MSKLRVLGACALLLSGAMHGANQLTINDIADALDALTCYKSQVKYEVLLASLSEPVTYNVQLQSTVVPGDTLAPCSYIIDWSMPIPNGTSEGFSAYLPDGSHFRYRHGNRMQEYHFENSAASFAPGGDTAKGVQCQAQFTDLLPQFIAAQLRRMAVDSTYSYTIKANVLYSGTPANVVEGGRTINGDVCAEYTYVFDPATKMPWYILLENNPGQIGEQSIKVSYQASATYRICDLSLQSLISNHTDAFENYRESAFSLERLPGKPLPTINARTIDGNRYYHHRGDALDAPTIIAFVDAEVATTPDVIKDIRKATEELPVRTDVVWAFLNHRAEDIAELMPAVLPGEIVLIDARSAARECGVGALTPIIIFVDKQGTVKDFVQGFNQDLTSIVIEKTMY